MEIPKLEDAQKVKAQKMNERVNQDFDNLVELFRLAIEENDQCGFEFYWPDNILVAAKTRFIEGLKEAGYKITEQKAHIYVRIE